MVDLSVVVVYRFLVSRRLVLSLGRRGVLRCAALVRDTAVLWRVVQEAVVIGSILVVQPFVAVSLSTLAWQSIKGCIALSSTSCGGRFGRGAISIQPRAARGRLGADSRAIVTLRLNRAVQEVLTDSRQEGRLLLLLFLLLLLVNCAR